MKSLLGSFFIFINLVLIIIFFTLNVFSEIGENLTVAEVRVNNQDSELVLNSGDSKNVVCEGIIWSNESIPLLEGYFYDSSVSSPFDGDDNNYHYSNNSCVLSENFNGWNGYIDDEDTYLVECSFSVEYYANSGNWDCFIFAEDSLGINDSNLQTIEILELLSFELDESLNYGQVNGLNVSDEQEIQISNLGNVVIDFELYSYGNIQGDDKAMQCSNGSVGYIPVEYQRYNIGSSDESSMSLSEFQSFYESFESEAEFKDINLNYRQNDVSNDALENVYTRIYVPSGVAGSCNGNIVFNFLKSS